MFVSKRIEGLTHIVHSKDCQEVRMRNREGKELRIFNIYNQPNNGEDTVNLLSQLIPPARDQEPGVSHLALKPGSITRNQAGSRTTIDLVFATEGLGGRIVLEQIHADSDHLPIRTIIDFDTPQPEQEKKRRNWKAMDEDKFSKFVQTNLQGKPWLNLPREVTPRRIDDAVEFIMEAQPSSRANPSFTPEYSEAIKARNRSQETGSIIPSLKRPDGSLADTNQAKVDILQKVFFPEPPPTDLDDIHENQTNIPAHLAAGTLGHDSTRTAGQSPRGGRHSKPDLASISRRRRIHRHHHLDMQRIYPRGL
ncbi:uncharacterized protein N7498_009072 [Penicillium cinerascens]|uniref:Endonuclease/exonuclease/phosphatase domain-containing protein n=1 Tax=Penicillium cinerascens TaxID=70096 RepID=A0A9W9JFV1_9EURO|nr:uncharacterized protein N7498_009072 [Penicillium cinerascens]KAJ5195634.1 hypothetical protein N7498_009072 [Penicillium cinerascens]